MENLNFYNHRVSVFFNNYLQGYITHDQLLQQLKRVEAQLKKEQPQGSLWFKFSQDDTLATTIPDLRKTFPIPRIENLLRNELERL